MNTLLSVGVNQYKDQYAWLEGCVPDANLWESNFQQIGFRSFKMLDKDAPKKLVLSEAEAILRTAERNSFVALMKSGHGTYRMDRNGDEFDRRDEGYVCWDMEVIWDDELYQILEARKRGVKVLLITDSCYSGTMVRWANSGMPPGKHRRIRFLPPEFIFGKKKAQKWEQRIARFGAPGLNRKQVPQGVFHLSGCLDSEYSYESEIDGTVQGVMGYYARKYMHSVKTYREWITKIRSELPSRYWPQTPALNTRRADMLDMPVFRHPNAPVRQKQRPTATRFAAG